MPHYMKQELSILIPTFNHSCFTLVNELVTQLRNIKLPRYEIIVVEDGSNNTETIKTNTAITQLEHCQHIINTHNLGRAKVRNLLTSLAQYQWLLFIDADMKIISPLFLETYIHINERHQVIYGGNSVYLDTEEKEYSLRYRYEKQAERNAHRHSVENFSRMNKNIHTSNLMIQKELMALIRFNENITQYGYEDILLGKELLNHGIEVHYINNPVGFTGYDNNSTYLQKTEESLHTLYHLRKQLQGFSSILSAVNVIDRFHLRSLFILAYNLLKSSIKKNLISNSPSLTLFAFYKLGYYLSISQKNEREIRQ